VTQQTTHTAATPAPDHRSTKSFLGCAPAAADRTT